MRHRPSAGRAIGRSALAVALAMLASVGTSTGAGATVVDRGTFDEQETYTDTLCGQPWTVTQTVSGRYQVRSDPAGTPFGFSHEVRTFRIDHVNDLGQSYAVSGRVNDRLDSVEPLGGDVYQLTASQAGSTWAMTSAGGTVVWRDRGIAYFTFALDTQGDDDPSNDEFVEGSYDMWWHGPHFFSDAEPGSQYCEYVNQALALG